MTSGAIPGKPPLDPAKQRRRGALSCAECRRLKLRCDRQFPCQSCRKRGCASICPDGALTTGKGNRFILANTEELHDKIEELQERIGSLEEGLQTIYASTSNSPEPHPLLTEKLLHIKTPLGAEIVGSGNPRHSHQPKHNYSAGRAGESSRTIEEDPEDVTDSFGTLTIADSHDRSKFFGVAAGSQFLLGEQVSDEEEKPCIDDLEKCANKPSDILPSEIAHMARSFPFSIIKPDWRAARDQLRNFLPAANVAWGLCENYFDNGAWLYSPVPRLYFIERIFTPIFNSDPHESDLSEPLYPPPSSHDYSLLFIILALGTILDLNRPPYPCDAHFYHNLSRASFGADEPCDSVTGVQALHLMCYFNQISESKSAAALSWSVWGLAYRMATAIGLHKDGKRWDLDPEEAERRRLVWWELVTFDAWASQALGRPPTALTAHVDAAYPADPVDGPEVTEPSFHRQKYIIASALINVLNEAFGAKRPSYDVILSLDRRIRDLEIPPSLQIPGLGNFGAPANAPPQPDTTSHIMQTHTIFCVKETSLIYLHRSYLARALAEYPEDPFKSRYAASVLAAHRSSCGVLAGVRNAYRRLPLLMPRVWFLWVHAFSASIVLATIVTRAPSSNLAPSSLKELDIVCELFELAKEGCRPAGALPVLLKLRAKAHLVYDEFRSGKRMVSPSAGLANADGKGADDLTMLGGQTRLVSSKRKGAGSSTGHSHPSPGSGGESPAPITHDQVHPALVEYLKAYNQQMERSDSDSPPSITQPYGPIATHLDTSSSSSSEYQYSYQMQHDQNQPIPRSHSRHEQQQQQQQQQQHRPSLNTSVGSSPGQYYSPSVDLGVHTPFSAFEPSSSGMGMMSGDVSMLNGHGQGGYGAVTNQQDNMDLGWQFMSDLRPFL